MGFKSKKAAFREEGKKRGRERRREGGRESKPAQTWVQHDQEPSLRERSQTPAERETRNGSRRDQDGSELEGLSDTTNEFHVKQRHGSPEARSLPLRPSGRSHAGGSSEARGRGWHYMAHLTGDAFHCPLDGAGDAALGEGSGFRVFLQKSGLGGLL